MRKGTDESLDCGIGNYYGNLTIHRISGKFYRSVENYSGHRATEITKETYDALVKQGAESTESVSIDID